MTIFEMSLGGAVIIAVVLLLRRLLLYRLPKWTFLLLWGVALCRLLVPFAIPSPVSVYTGAAQVVQALQETDPPASSGDPLPLSPTFPGTFREDVWTSADLPAQTPPPEEPASPLPLIWLAGAVLCGLFFLAAGGWALARFRGAVPAEEAFVLRWRAEHPTLLPIRINVSLAVSAPLAYGLIRPVILLPQNTDWTDEGRLTYVLTHEYVHIRRGDLVWKLLLTAALCLHWFNPLVWAMYFCANRDLELACDEAVVRILGPDSRKGYAHALLAAEEGRFSPLCTPYATKYHMEERIQAIITMKKQTVTALLVGLVLVAGVTAVFATSRVPENLEDLPLAQPSEPVAAPAQPSGSENQVHPVTGEPAGSIDAQPWDFGVVSPEDGEAGGTVVPELAPEDRVHPVTEIAAKAADKTPRKKAKPSSKYPINSKGHTYGVWTQANGYGDVPDLIYIRVNSKVEGYLKREEIYPYSWPLGPDSTWEELQRYLDWFHKLTKNEKPEWTYGSYGLTATVYDQEENSTREFCAGFSMDFPHIGRSITDTMMLERVAQGNPLTWTLFLGTAPVKNIAHRYTRPCTIEPRDDETLKRLAQWTENGDWRKNSKGQTYGPLGLDCYVGYDPDLIQIPVWSDLNPSLPDKILGYISWNALKYGNYPHPVNTNEDYQACLEWQYARPATEQLPVYNLEGTQVVGHMEYHNARYSPQNDKNTVQLTPEERAQLLEEQRIAYGW